MVHLLDGDIKSSSRYPCIRCWEILTKLVNGPQIKIESEYVQVKLYHITLVSHFVNLV